VLRTEPDDVPDAERGALADADRVEPAEDLEPEREVVFALVRGFELLFFAAGLAALREVADAPAARVDSLRARVELDAAVPRAVISWRL
jgi:hypothetical protein